MQRKIIHIDMDAFFASVEQRDFPELKGKPVAVGGNSERGVIAAASYEARKFGVRSAMSSKVAQRLCPQLIFQKHRFEVYKEVSQQIREIFFEYTDLVEPLSLDEAFLDVTENKKGIESATQVAREIKQKIFETTHLTASAGVSVNKFLAKVASDQRKPNGMFIIKPGGVQAFVEQLPIEKFFGVGKKTAEKMHQLDIHKGKDLLRYDLSRLVHYFGKAGQYFYDIARGNDERPVRPHRERKSVGIENTFSKDLVDEQQIQLELNRLKEGLIKRLSKSGKQGKTLTLKVKFDNFEQITRSKTVIEPIGEKLLNELSSELVREAPLNRPIRLLGLTVSNFKEDDEPEALQLRINFKD
ncbi:DNA polymerase IV [Carboxylicivirga mesophila]|uniref:DNA polymerase IV n=1 Tax=Carboxylicivirga mesophila TaxID=1166478 RepID=A0ABS5KHB3_9BACT|nr:DNA polymerase IV [Carboxylicivirga mesophila]MBS2213826.1 DNA polymerase IV [Carboxylicivirga mesophila]